MAKGLQQLNEVRRKLSLRDFLAEGGEEAEWINTTKARDLFEELRAEEADERICKRQADRLANEPSQSKKTLRRAFMKLFTTSKLGLGITFTGAGKRKGKAQSEFRKSLIDSYGCQHPEQDWLWCPILKTWKEAKATQAAHLFAYMHGQEVMDAIFGPTASSELFSPRNGMIVSGAVEDVLDMGFMVIVPRLPDNPSAAEVSSWNLSTPKEYKIRIIDHESKLCNRTIRPESSQTWKDLDGTNVEFLNDFRPRARYIYFHYCVQMLRHAWKEQRPGQSLKKQMGSAYWGTPGRYLPRNMLMAFVEEMGHEYEQLLEGAMDDAAAPMDEDSEILLAAAMDQIKVSAAKREGEYFEESDDDDDEAWETE